MLDLSGLFDYLNSAGFRYERDYPLASLSSFRIGGPAAAVAFPRTSASFIDLLAFLTGHDVPFLILGNGTNTLFPDSGFVGCVICLSSFSSYSINKCNVTCDAGTPLALLTRKVSEAGLGNLSYAAGIPGTVGGAIYMNAGAYGGEIGNHVIRCTVLDVKDNHVFDLTHEQLEFGYRSSVFQKHPEWIILSVEIELTLQSSEEMLAAIERFRMERSAKQPLNYPSAGSTFKRPATGFAGQMIEACGLKGYTVGGACVSEKHAGFIINKGHATAADVRELIDVITGTVWEKYKVLLEPEIRIMEENHPQ